MKAGIKDDFHTPMGPDVADMACRQDTQFEMPHRLRLLFRCGDLTSLGHEALSAKIVVSRVLETEELERIEATEVLETTDSPSWMHPIVIDYCMEETCLFYKAELVDSRNGAETVVAETNFKLAELITSKGQYIFKRLEKKTIEEELAAAAAQ